MPNIPVQQPQSSAIKSNRHGDTKMPREARVSFKKWRNEDSYTLASKVFHNEVKSRAATLAVVLKSKKEVQQHIADEAYRFISFVVGKLIALADSKDRVTIRKKDVAYVLKHFAEKTYYGNTDETVHKKKAPAYVQDDAQ